MAQARRDVYNMAYGLGIHDVGQPLGPFGLHHPLAEEFGAGPELFFLVHGYYPSTALTGEPAGGERRGRPRRRREESAEGDEEERRVRPRLDDGEAQLEELELIQQQLQQESERQEPGQDYAEIMGDVHPPSEAELGRRAPSVQDHRGVVPSSSGMMPWNRTPSVRAPQHLLSSLAKARYSSAVGRRQGSPLTGHGRQIQYAERMSSDPVGAGYGGVGESSYSGQNDPALLGDSFELPGTTMSPGLPAAVPAVDAPSPLDREGEEFLEFAEEVARKAAAVAPENGAEAMAGGARRVSIDFDALVHAEELPAGVRRHEVAAMAFYNVLTLTTKGRMSVEQEGEGVVPFGNITVSLDVPDLPQMDAEAAES